MRQIEYLSPTSVGKWLQERDEFYLSYLTDDRPPKPPQTQPMAVGSAFDAYIKADLYKTLGVGTDPAYSFEALFEHQVEEQNRDWARPAGQHCYDAYKALGAYDAILAQLRASDVTPRFEFELRGPVTHLGESIVFLGKPDVVFQLQGQTIVYDWKVNGFCGKYAKSPEPGYTLLRGGSRGAGKPHKDCMPQDVNGITINTRGGLESIKGGDWARQVSIYAWLLGAPVGSDFVSGIDQLVGKPGDLFPEIRVAEHRYRVGMMFQNAVFSTAAAIHKAIANDHIFDDLSFEDDKKRRSALDKMGAAFNPADDRDKLFLAMTR